MTTILLDDHGRLLAPPDAPSSAAPIEETISWIRAHHAWRDQVTDTANRAFDDAFRKALKDTPR